MIYSLLLCPSPFIHSISIHTHSHSLTHSHTHSLTPASHQCPADRATIDVDQEEDPLVELDTGTGAEAGVLTGTVPATETQADTEATAETIATAVMAVMAVVTQEIIETVATTATVETPETIGMEGIHIETRGTQETTEPQIDQSLPQNRTVLRTQPWMSTRVLHLPQGRYPSLLRSSLSKKNRRNWPSKRYVALSGNTFFF